MLMHSPIITSLHCKSDFPPSPVQYPKLRAFYTSAGLLHWRAVTEHPSCLSSSLSVSFFLSLHVLVLRSARQVWWRQHRRVAVAREGVLESRRMGHQISECSQQTDTWLQPHIRVDLMLFYILMVLVCLLEFLQALYSMWCWNTVAKLPSHMLQDVALRLMRDVKFRKRDIVYLVTTRTEIREDRNLN
jgi:hypothetical protein